MTPPKTLRVQPGDRYGRLTVLSETRLPNTPGRIRHGFTDGPPGARCLCDCGRETAVAASSLISGNTRSCGCLRIEIATARLPGMVEANRVHGLSRRARHPLYGTWRGMMARCYDERHRWYSRYGGRGIRVCPQWHDVTRFVRDIESALGPRPAGMTLDRAENDGNYEPGNVRWATRSQQVRNRSPFRKRLSPSQLAEARSRRSGGATLRELAEEYGVSIATMHRYTKG